MGTAQVLGSGRAVPVGLAEGKQGRGIAAVGRLLQPVERKRPVAGQPAEPLAVVDGKIVLGLGAAGFRCLEEPVGRLRRLRPAVYALMEGERQVDLGLDAPGFGCLFKPACGFGLVLGHAIPAQQGGAVAALAARVAFHGASAPPGAGGLEILRPAEAVGKASSQRLAGIEAAPLRRLEEPVEGKPGGFDHALAVLVAEGEAEGGTLVAPLCGPAVEHGRGKSIPGRAYALLIAGAEVVEGRGRGGACLAQGGCRQLAVLGHALAVEGPGAEHPAGGGLSLAAGALQQGPAVLRRVEGMVPD